MKTFLTVLLLGCVSTLSLVAQQHPLLDASLHAWQVTLSPYNATSTGDSYGCLYSFWFTAPGDSSFNPDDRDPQNRPVREVIYAPDDRVGIIASGIRCQHQCVRHA